MDVRMRIAVADETLNVSEFCRVQGISRQTFYVWRRRYRQEGDEGLQQRSRAPKTTSQRIDPEVEDAIVQLRKELRDLGVDHGAATIQYHLPKRLKKVSKRRHRVPSLATIWRVLSNRGFVDPQPRKRPKTAMRRFEATAPNELWQADFIEWTIGIGVVKIISFIDDHSRVALRVKAVPEATTEAAWQGFSQASEAWGVPLGQLTDNGLCFSGKLRGFEVQFEICLRAAGVVPKTSRPFHPQTCGKVERFQQTLKKWLRKRPMADDLAGLQAQIDEFVAYYNHVRPHQGIGRLTPIERWQATPPAINLGVALPGPANRYTGTVTGNGQLKAGGMRIGIGKAHAGRTATTHWDDNHFAVYIDHQLVRAGVIDHSHPEQPLHGHRRPRHLP
jgi:transposase InsO family protein